MRSYGVVIALTLLCAIVHLPLMADETESEEGDELWEASLGDILDINVTVASSFAETDLESGSTVAMVSNKQWTKHGASTLTEAVGYLPGTFLVPTIWGGSALAIRGYMSNLSVRGIATVLDGVPLNTSQNGTALYSTRSIIIDTLDRAEMIRGPGSALYGSDAFHGVLSLKSKHYDENNASVSARVTSEKQYQAAVNVSQHLSDTISTDIALAAVMQEATNTPYDYTVPGTSTVRSSSRDDEYDGQNVFLKFHYNTGDDLKASIGFYHLASETEEGFGASRSLGTSGLSILQDNDYSVGDYEQNIFSYNMEWKLSDSLTFEAKAYLWEKDSLFRTNIILPAPSGLSQAVFNFEESHNGVDVLLKQSENSFNTQWAFGLSSKNSEIDKATTGFSDIAGVLRSPARDGTSLGFSREVLSAILEARTKAIADTFHIIWGGRFDKYSDFGNQTTPRVGLVYLQERSSLKLLYGEAFRAPTAGELNGSGRILGNPDLEPEVIETLELVYIHKFEGAKLSATVFQSDWTNGIVNIPITDAFFSTSYANTGENEAFGVELGITGVMEAWSYDANITYVDSKAIGAGTETDYAAFPEYIINLNFGYTFPESEMELYVTNRIHLEAKESPTTSVLTNPVDIDDYFSTNINLMWALDSNLDLNVSAVNIFDQDNVLPSIWGAENGVQASENLQRLQIDLNYSF